MTSQRPGRGNREDNDINDMTASERKTLVTEVVMYLISQEATKIPTKRASIIKAVLGRHSKSFRTIIAEAKSVLKEVFGYRLIDCDGKYFLINLFPPSEIGLKILNEPEEHKKRCSLLTLVLSLIFMEGGAVKDDEMRDFLRRLNIQVSDLSNPVFGDVKKLLTKVYGNREEDWPVQLKQLEHGEQSEAQDLTQLMHKKMRLSQTPASQSSSSSQRISSRNFSQRRGISPSPIPGPSSRS